MHKSRRPHPDYLRLIDAMPLRPIRSNAQLRQAYSVLDRLSVIDEAKLTQGQADYLFALSDLVWVYEQRSDPIDLSHLDGIDALRFLLEQNDMSASDLGRLLGSRQLGAAILRRQRELSKANILALCEHFRVSADLFLRSGRLVA